MSAATRIDLPDVRVVCASEPGDATPRVIEDVEHVLLVLSYGPSAEIVPLADGDGFTVRAWRSQAESPILQATIRFGPDCRQIRRVAAPRRGCTQGDEMSAELDSEGFCEHGVVGGVGCSECEPVVVGVACGVCGGPVFMETCESENGRVGHHWVVGSECKRCGERNDDPALICHDCDPA